MRPDTDRAPLPITNATRADALESIRERLDELYDEARELLQGTGPILIAAKPWLSRLDQAMGTEPTVTIEDTIEQLRSET